MAKKPTYEELEHKVKKLEKEAIKRKLTQEAGKGAEQERDVVLDTLVELVVHQDTRMKILWANRAACESAGLTLEQLLGRHCYEIWPQRKDPCPDCPVIKAMETGRQQEVEKYTPDKRAWFIRGYPVRDEKGEIVGAVEVTLEITERKQAEEALQKVHDELEQRVEERTAELAAANKKLQAKITERKQAEEALEAERRRLFSLLEELPAFVYLQAPDYSVRFANRYFRKHFGNPEGKLCYEVLWGAKEPCKPCPTFRVFDTKKPQVWEWSQSPNGLIYEINDYPFSDVDGSPLVLELGIDITERKQAEEKIKELARFPGENPNPVLRVAKNGTVLYANDSSLPLLNLWGCQVNQPLPDEWRKLILDALSSRLSKDTETKCEDRVFSLTFAPVVGTDYLNVYGLDITDRKQMEEALKESEEKYRKLFEEIPDPIFVADPETGILIDCNYAASELVGRKRSELIGKHQRILHPPEEIEGGYSKSFKKHLEEQEGRVLEDLVITKKGEIKNVAIRANVIEVEGKKQIQGMFRDITEQKQAENKLKKSREELRNLSAYLQSAREQERTVIAREIHDELGQDLTALKMDLSWLNKRLPKDKKMLFEKINSMTELVDTTIQSVKRISSELRPGLLDDLGLTAAMEWMAEGFQNRTGIKCKFTVDPEDITLDQDRSTGIFRIFQETLTNVARHTKATQVKAVLQEEAGFLVLTVSDNGKGITKKQVSDSESFGLIGMRERAHHLNGELHIVGTRGTGTEVTVKIPVKKSEQVEREK